MYNFFEVANCDLKKISWGMSDLAEKTEVNVPVMLDSTEEKIENLTRREQEIPHFYKWRDELR